MSHLPSISIITNFFNPDLEIFQKSLESIKKQKYPKKLVEHLIMDAGSTTPAISLAKKYGCKIISKPDLVLKSQERLSLGIKASKHDIILILETDNILIGSDWLLKMVEPFIREEDISFTYSMYNGYKKDMPLLTKYFALFGVNDIYLYYLKKTEKMPLDNKEYDKGEIIKKEKNYYVVKFVTKDLPPLGDNGIMIRRKIINGINNNPKKFLHTDAVYNLVQNGYNHFGVVKNSIIHYSGGNIIKQYKNRVLMKKMFYDKYRGKRDYLTFNPNSKKEIINTIKFSFYSMTFFFPFIRSIQGYLKKREIAWFLNPIVCFVAFTMYVYSEITFFAKRHKEKITILGTKTKWWLKDSTVDFIHLILSPVKGVIVIYSDKKRQEIYRLVRKIKSEKKTLVAENEGIQLYALVKSTQKIEGDIAEVGVFNGGTAKIICEAGVGKKIYLFDTFEGLPHPTTYDLKEHYQGEFKSNYLEVKKYLRDYKKVFFCQGLFPDSASTLSDHKFSFAHLDVDLYISTYKALSFFYPRMEVGGVILSHDYNGLPGVHKAFQEFFINKREPIIEIGGSQCVVVKI